MKVIFVSILCTFVSLAHATDQVPSALTQHLAKSIEDLSNKLEYCRVNEQSLDDEKLQALSLDKSQLKVVLAYQFSRLHFECSKKEYVDYLIASKGIQCYQRTYKKKWKNQDCLINHLTF